MREKILKIAIIVTQRLLRGYSLMIICIMIGICMGCATTRGKTAATAGFDTVSNVDLKKYQGKWYEIARLPMWFQRDCVCSTAQYTLLESGRVTVINECTTKTGKHKKAEGYAVVVDKQTNAKLAVVFNNFFTRILSPFIKGKYWIFYLDENYQRAIVGTPDRKFLWILARTPSLDEEVYQELIRLCQEKGFDTSNLIRGGCN